MPTQQPENFYSLAFNSGASFALLEQAKLNSQDKSRRVRKGIPFERDYYMTASFFASPESLENVGCAYNPLKPITREATRLVIQKTISNLWKLCPDEIQQQFPLESIPLNKPRSIKLRQRISFSQDPRTQKVMELTNQGISPDEIKSRLDLSTNEFKDKRKTLANWGIELGYVKGSAEYHQWVVKALTDPSVPEEQFNSVVSNLTITSAIGLAKNKQALISLNDIVGISGIFIASRNISQIKEVLEETDISVLSFPNTVKSGKNKGLIQNFYFIAKRELTKATELLKSHHSLQQRRENPVNQIAGPDTNSIPTTTEVNHKRGYQSIISLLKEYGLANGNRPKILTERFFSTADCPTPIFRSFGSVVYPKSQEQALRKFIVKRKEELGI